MRASNHRESSNKRTAYRVRTWLMIGWALALWMLADHQAKAQPTLWETHGSTLLLAAQGANYKFIFQSTRGEYARRGVAAGALLFDGERSGHTLSGIAYIFAAGCNPESFEVAGGISSDEKVVTLKGRAPIRNAACMVTSYQEQTLILSEQPAPPPTSAPPPDQQASVPRPQSYREECATADLSSGPEKYCASSVLPPQAGNSYGVSNLFTGSNARAWIEGQVGQGINEWILIEFSGLRLVTGYVIDNGYQKNQDVFYKNSRVKAIEVRYSGGEREMLSLQDRFGTQVFAATRATKAEWVQFIIKDVYPGSKYTDTAISKLSVRSQPTN